MSKAMRHAEQGFTHHSVLLWGPRFPKQPHAIIVQIGMLKDPNDNNELAFPLVSVLPEEFDIVCELQGEAGVCCSFGEVELVGGGAAAVFLVNGEVLWCGSRCWC